MSIKLVAQAWEHKMTHAQRAVIQALADHAHDDGSKVFPSYAYVAWKTDYSVRQVMRVVEGLIKIGAVTRVVRGNSRKQSNVYRINIEILPRKSPFKTSDKVSSLDKKLVTPLSATSDISTRTSDIAMSHQSPSEPSYKPKKRARVTPKDSRAEEETRKRRIRDKIQALRFTAQARDARLIAVLTDTTPEEVQRELEAA